jgi:DnaJ like chaperone protein
MTIWGKIIGGAAGLAMGGPLGALAGAAAGHLVDDQLDRHGPQADPRVPKERQAAFIMGVIALSAKMAKADGQVTPDEIAAFHEIVRAPKSEMRHIEWVFDQARQSSAGFESYARQLGRLFKDSPQLLEDLLDGLFHIARADGIFHSGEDAYLREVAKFFGFGPADYERIKARNLPDFGGPYAVLGLTASASNEEVKAAYRRLVKAHHPDAMIARGVPEEFIAVANSQLAAINGAYEKIEKMRGL